MERDKFEFELEKTDEEVEDMTVLQKISRANELLKLLKGILVIENMTDEALIEFKELLGRLGQKADELRKKFEEGAK